MQHEEVQSLASGLIWEAANIPKSERPIGYADVAGEMGISSDSIREYLQKMVPNYKGRYAFTRQSADEIKRYVKENIKAE